MRKRLLQMSERARRNPRLPLDPQLPALVEKFLAINPASPRPHDAFVRIAIEQAFLGANLGNFAVGAVIVDSAGRVVQRGHSRVLRPYLRTDLHAEMHAVTCIEERYKFRSRKQVLAKLEGSSLFSSLEPCPMCLSRLILSGVHKVYYAADELKGGMAHIFGNMPEIWRQIATDKGMVFEKADCSTELEQFAWELFIRSAEAGGSDSDWHWK
jgi:tRNA(adenine34) deaminase